MSKTYIAYDDAKVIIGFENSDGELEYTIYLAEDGGTEDNFSKSNFKKFTSIEGIDEVFGEIKELS